MNVSFDFPDDKGKEPLVSFTVNCGEKDFKQLEQTMLFKSGGTKHLFTVKFVKIRKMIHIKRPA